MSDKRTPLKKGEEAARLSTIILLVLGILKGITSLASGSVALLAGTIDSFSDVFSSIAVWAGLNIAKRKPTERFPYGYFKAFQRLGVDHCSCGLAHRKKTRIAIPIVEDKGLESSVSLHFGNAPYFEFIDVEEGQIVGSYVKENEGAKLSHKKGIQAAHLLVEENVDVVLAGGIGEGPFHIIGDNLIQIYSISKSLKINEAVSLLNENLLQKMTLPTEEHGEDKIE